MVFLLCARYIVDAGEKTEAPSNLTDLVGEANLNVMQISV